MVAPAEVALQYRAYLTLVRNKLLVTLVELVTVIVVTMFYTSTEP